MLTLRPMCAFRIVESLSDTYKFEDAIPRPAGAGCTATTSFFSAMEKRRTLAIEQASLEPCRRQVLRYGLGGIAALLPSHLLAARYTKSDALKQGEFSWAPDRAPDGAVVVIVSIPEQRLHVYRNGVEIGVSPCSTGKPGHRTPTGVFTVLEKQRKHVSSIYKGAQMPNMQRLTWGGIALHAGNLPGYPASHGCIRLPMQFSSLLFEVTHVGTVVIVADERTQPETVVHPGLLLPTIAEREARALSHAIASKPKPGSWQTTVKYPVSSVLVSRTDGKAYVTQGGRLLGAYPARIADRGKRIGTHVYTLLGPSADFASLMWLAFGVGKAPHEAHVVSWQGDTALRRVNLQGAQARAITDAFHPGTTLMITDASAPAATRATAKDFAVIASDDA